MANKPIEADVVSEDGSIFIFDCPDADGMRLFLPIDGTNLRLDIFITDEEAENIIKIMQNKLNGRLPK